MEYIDKLKEKVDSDPHSTLFVPLAEEYRKVGLLDDAINVLIAGIERQPSYTSAKVALGKLYLAKEQPNEARIIFEQVVNSNPDNFYAQKKLAEIYRILGDVPSSIERYRALLGMNPMDEAAQKELEELEMQVAAEADRTAEVEPVSIVPELDTGIEPEVMEEAAVIEETPVTAQEHEGFAMPFARVEDEAGTPVNLDEEMRNFSTSLSDKDSFGASPFGDEDLIGGGFESSLADKGEIDIPMEPQEENDQDGFGDTRMFSPMAGESFGAFEKSGVEDVPGLEATEREEPVSDDAIEIDIDEAMSLGDLMAEVSADNSAPRSIGMPEVQRAEDSIGMESVYEEPQSEVQSPATWTEMPTINYEMLLGEADFSVATENYPRAMSIYNEILLKDPKNNMVLQRASELQMLLKMLGRESEMMEAKLTAFSDALKRRRDEFFGNA